MTLFITKKIIEYDLYELKIYMNQCKEKNNLKKSIQNLSKISYSFFTERIITHLIIIVIGIFGISIII